MRTLPHLFYQTLTNGNSKNETDKETDKDSKKRGTEKVKQARKEEVLGADSQHF